jgi:hypothetical protein
MKIDKPLLHNFQVMEQRFWNKVNKTDTCWLWTGSIDKQGYGRVRYGKKLIATHRASWLLSGNTIPEGLVICHAPHEICGNRHCVNPAHLRTDTKGANATDRIADGTSARGTKNPGSILTEEQVRAIRANTENKRYNALAREYGVCASQISNIIRRNAWYWLN